MKVIPMMATQISQSEINKYVAAQKAKSTVYKEKSTLNIFRRFCESLNETRDLHELSANDLDNILCNYYMNAKTRKGELFEPNSLSNFRDTIQRLLYQKDVRFDLKVGQEFKNSRQVLSARKKELKKLGKGNRPNATQPLTADEIDYLYEIEYFGVTNAVNLQRNLWFILTTQFGQRAREDVARLNLGDLKVERDSNGEEALFWDTERSIKTKTGGKPMGHNRQRVFNLKAYKLESEKYFRCPVFVWNFFLSKRPPLMRDGNSPVFLKAKPTNTDFSTEPIWFTSIKLGKNFIGGFMSHTRLVLTSRETKVVKVENDDEEEANVSDDEDVKPIDITHLTGSEGSMSPYIVPSQVEEKDMYRIRRKVLYLSDSD